jgi:hypothetical protein
VRGQCEALGVRVGVQVAAGTVLAVGGGTRANAPLSALSIA